MDVTGWPLLEETYSGEAEVVHMAQDLVGAARGDRNVRRTTLSVWPIRTSYGNFHVVFWAPVSRVDVDWKATTLAESIHFIHKSGDYGVFTATTPTGELFQFEVFPTHGQ